MEVFNFMSQYIPNTEADRRAMLDAIGVASIDELFSDIPAQVRLAKALDLPEALSEPELARHLRALSGKNRNLDELTCFLAPTTISFLPPSKRSFRAASSPPATRPISRKRRRARYRPSSSIRPWSAS